MLDENLPAFFLKPSTTGVKHHAAIYLSHRGSEPAPIYSLQYLDPASIQQTHKNCYAAALFDAFIPDVLFGEVLVRPSWTQPTLSAEEIRRNGGIPPPPEPRVPTEFNIQLYNPDQQVTVKLKEGKWGSSDTYEFSLPEKTFRAPSASTLDRGQSDPGTLDITPRINFVWKREHKLSKDLSCFMTGKSTDHTEKKRSKRDPDINIALWRSMREMTLYESNLGRIDTEDPKGLEVTLLISAIVIKDLYFASKDRVPELFNLDAINSGRRTSNPQQVTSPRAGVPPPLPQRRPDEPHHSNSAPAQITIQPPPPDPREKWQIEAESARLRAAADAEARDVARRRRDQEKAAELERRRLKKMVEEEQKNARRRADEVDRETERLRKLYGLEGQGLPDAPPRRQEEPPRRSFQGDLQGRPVVAGPSNAAYMSGANGNPSMLSIPGSNVQPKKKKSSFFGHRSTSDELSPSSNRLTKKQSAMW